MKKARFFNVLFLFMFLVTGCLGSQPGTQTDSKAQSDTQAGQTSEARGKSQAEEDSTPTAGSQAVGPASNGEGSAEEVKPDAVATFSVSGDVLSHITNTEAVKQKDGTYDYLPHFEEMQELMSQADYTIVNLESHTAGEKYGYTGFPMFNAPVNLAETMKKIGVDMTITANNHAMDNGVEGLKDNLDNLDEIGLDHTGTFRTPEEEQTPKIIEVNGIKVGVIASTMSTNGIPVPEEHLVNFNEGKEVKANVKRAREAGAEAIIYHVHWGREYTEYPSEVQMKFYKKLAKEGIDVVIGSHPHRLQPMEMREIEYQGEKKDQIVIWSTANMYQGQTKQRDYINTGAVFHFALERKDGKVVPKDLSADLIYNIRWKDKTGQEHYKVVAEEHKEKYRQEFPKQIKKMEEEFQWAEKTLANPVDLSPVE